MTASSSMASFDAFYRSHNRRLFYYLRNQVGRETAPDLVQEAFTRMLRSGALERVENPRAYLIRTAHNLVIERARQMKRKQSGVHLFDDERDAPVPPSQSWRIEEADLRRILRKALLALPRRSRRIFLMHRLQRLTYREIAERLGVAEKTVEHHMGRALARCRKAIAKRYA